MSIFTPRRNIARLFKSVAGVAYEELLLSVSISASAAESDVQQMLETGKVVSVNASVAKTDNQQMLDTGKAVSIAASVSESDTQQMLETGRGVTINAAVDVVVPVWVGISSSHLYSHCGSTGPRTLAEALNGTDYWQHVVNHTHEFIVDLGSTQLVTAVRGRSNRTSDPTNVNIYVSDDVGDFGAAVVSGITIWQDTVSWVVIDTVDKSGRYVKVEATSTENINDYMDWGNLTPFTIFDVQVEKGEIMQMLETGKAVSIDASTSCIDTLGLLAMFAFVILRQHTS